MTRIPYKGPQWTNEYQGVAQLLNHMLSSVGVLNLKRFSTCPSIESSTEIPDKIYDKNSKSQAIAESLFEFIG